jgi:hypothetical protein
MSTRRAGGHPCSPISASVSPRPSMRLVFVSTSAMALREHSERLLIAGARVAHRMRQAPHGLGRSARTLEPGIDHASTSPHALKSGVSALTAAAGVRRLIARCTGVARRAAVGQVVAVHGRQHYVFQAHQLDAGGDVRRLIRVEPAARAVGVDGTEAAGARTPRPSQDRRGAGVPALRCGAFGFAHGRSGARARCGARSRSWADRRRRLEQRGCREVGCGPPTARLDAVADRRVALRRSVLRASALAAR